MGDAQHVTNTANRLVYKLMQEVKRASIPHAPSQAKLAIACTNFNRVYIPTRQTIPQLSRHQLI